MNQPTFKIFSITSTKKLGVFKFQINIHINLKKPDETRTAAYLSSSMVTLTSIDQILTTINKCKQEVNARVDNFTTLGSGWIVEEVVLLEVKTEMYI